MRALVRTTTTTFVGAVAVAAMLVPAYAQTPEPTPTTTPSVTTTPSAAATPSATATASTTPSVTPTARETAPVTKRVTATYECGAAHFTNPLDKPVTILYGTAQTDDVEGRVTIVAGGKATIESTNKAFGWTAWPTKAGGPDQSVDDVGHLWLPGEDLSCDEPDDSAPPKPDSRGLANTGL